MVDVDTNVDFHSFPPDDTKELLMLYLPSIPNASCRIPKRGFLDATDPNRSDYCSLQQPALVRDDDAWLAFPEHCHLDSFALV